ncbi:Ig-like domain-containing protein [Rahnella sp. CFA14(1/10)]|uniref:Ig-like domain-containing protein n=1 Tax=Rahnella sp. CFA14(1/10) TaxID=2511203 RepID=UPI001F1110A6|nr:Ig-like domain-containing protein [Rahnella sp. CFA14(1/10)]
MKLSLTSINNSQPADGTSPILMLASATDDAGNPVSSTQLDFSVAGAVIGFDHAITDGSGNVTVTLVSNTAGNAALTASLPDGSVSVTALVTFIAVPADGTDVVNPIPAVDAATAALSPLEALKDDFNKVVAFIEHGIEVLGKDAEADLVALKDKYL